MHLLSPFSVHFVLLKLITLYLVRSTDIYDWLLWWRKVNIICRVNSSLLFLATVVLLFMTFSFALRSFIYSVHGRKWSSAAAQLRWLDTTKLYTVFTTAHSSELTTLCSSLWASSWYSGNLQYLTFALAQYVHTGPAQQQHQCTDIIYGHHTELLHKNCGNKMIFAHFIVNRTNLRF